MNRTRGVAYLAAAIAAIAITIIGPGAAVAGDLQYPTIFTKFKYELKDGEAKFKGAISSSKNACLADRKVVLKRTKNGDAENVGKDRTNDKGKFEIDLGDGKPKDGIYFAKVKDMNLDKSRAKELKDCLGRDSPEVKVSG